MKNIIFIAGPPGAGKTEFIKQYGFNNYRVFDLDNYRKIDKKFSLNNPLSYSENTIADAGLRMNSDINKSLLNNLTIVIETTFSSLNNTLERVKKSNDYQIYVYLFVVDRIEAYVSILERFIINYNNGNLCRIISFKNYLKKVEFYDEYINIIKNYNIDISYVRRNDCRISLFKYYPVFDIYYNIEHYVDRINRIKQFCSHNNIFELNDELNKMLHYFENHDKMKRVIK